MEKTEPIQSTQQDTRIEEDERQIERQYILKVVVFIKENITRKSDLELIINELKKIYHRKENLIKSKENSSIQCPSSIPETGNEIALRRFENQSDKNELIYPGVTHEDIAKVYIDILEIQDIGKKLELLNVTHLQVYNIVTSIIRKAFKNIETTIINVLKVPIQRQTQTGFRKIRGWLIHYKKWMSQVEIQLFSKFVLTSQNIESYSASPAQILNLHESIILKASGKKWKKTKLPRMDENYENQIKKEKEKRLFKNQGGKRGRRSSKKIVDEEQKKQIEKKEQKIEERPSSNQQLLTQQRSQKSNSMNI